MDIPFSDMGKDRGVAVMMEEELYRLFVCVRLPSQTGRSTVQ
jgi:hypothetical protein